MRRVAVLVIAVLGALLALSGTALAAAPTATTGPATNVGSGTATLTATVNVEGNTLDPLMPLPTAAGCYFEYGTTSLYGNDVPCSPTPSGSDSETVTANLTGLAPSTEYQYQVVLVYEDDPPAPLLDSTVDGGNQSFTTPATADASAPTVTTDAATDVYSTTAQLNGTVNPGGETLSSCEFEYSTSEAALLLSPQTTTVNCSTTPSGSTTVPVSAVLTGLTPNTTYYYELTATNVRGSNTGSVESFDTGTTSAPAPTGTNPPTAGPVNDTSATVSASVNPQGSGVVSCTFQYGTSTSYGSQAPCSPTPSGSNSQAVSAKLTGLSAATTYHFQVVLVTGGGTWSSSDASFTTMSATTGAASVGATAAAVTGTVDPEGQTVTGCQFIYGTSGAALKAVPCAQPASSLTGSSNVSVSAGLTGLTPKSLYGYEVVIETSGGGVASGGAKSFTTTALPSATTQKATSVTATTAVLHATVDAQGAAVLGCAFQYGVTSFGTSGTGSAGLEVACKPAPSGTGSSSVSVTLKGLAPNTKYYFRILFDAGGVPVVGSTLSFKTSKPGASSGKKPGVRITRSKISRRAHSAEFWFGKKNYAYTRAQCSLAVVRRGHVLRHSYSRCKSPKTYKHLKAGTYRFYVRLGNKQGWGSATSKRFKI